jgi:hypothetical protein
MRWSDIPRNPESRTLRQFAALCLVVFGGLACLEYFHERPVAAAVLAALAMALGPLGLVRPRAVRGVFVGWMMLAFPIGWIVSHVVLAFVYYGVFTPVGWFQRRLGRDALLLRRPRSGETCFRTRPQPADVRRYFRQY